MTAPGSLRGTREPGGANAPCPTSTLGPRRLLPQGDKTSFAADHRGVETRRDGHVALSAGRPGASAWDGCGGGVAATGGRAPRLAWIAPIGVLLMMAAVTGMAALGGHV